MDLDQENVSRRNIILKIIFITQ